MIGMIGQPNVTRWLSRAVQLRHLDREKAVRKFVRDDMDAHLKPQRGANEHNGIAPCIAAAHRGDPLAEGAPVPSTRQRSCRLGCEHTAQGAEAAVMDGVCVCCDPYAVQIGFVLDVIDDGVTQRVRVEICGARWRETLQGVQQCMKAAAVVAGHVV